MYQLTILAVTYLVTQLSWGQVLKLYKSNNAHRQLEPFYQAEMEYKAMMAELEALEEDDDDEDEDDDDDDDDDDDED